MTSPRTKCKLETPVEHRPQCGPPCHTPIASPIHWQDEVKAGLDRDVRLGELEKVPLGTPVTVPPHGDMHQEERVAHQFPTPEPARHAGNTPLPVSFPPGPGHSTPNQEYHIRRVEWLPLRSTIQGRPPRLLPHGVDIDISPPPKDTSLRVMPTRPGTTPSSPT